jgi:parvulin-like peptidyl-prolyl isomerase
MRQHARFASGPLGRCAKGMAFGVLAVLWACEAESGRILARAAGHELTVDQMVEILARQNTVPNQPDVVDALANFWIDYTLIGVRARDDSLFTTLDLDPLLRPQLEQETIDEYMNSVVRPDTAISEPDLRAMWEANPPADSVRAQHILVAFPEQATQAQVDSVAAFAAQLKARAAAGESFEALARQYSEDSGSAVQGGDIGFFGRGMLVPSFEEAAFSLAVGEVSDPVLGSFGLHVIKVTDRKAPTFEGARSTFRDSLVVGRLLEADSILLAQIDQEGEIEVETGAVTVLRELAMNPGTSLSARAANRTLVSYRGGSYSVSDALLLLNTQQTNLPGQLATAPDEALSNLLSRLGQAQVLLARAAEAGITPSQERIDSLDSQTRRRIREATDELGLQRIALSEGESADDALDRTTLQVLREISAGTRGVVQMAAIIVSLRREADWEIRESSIAATVERIDDLRGIVEEAPNQPVPVPSSAPLVADSVQN